MELKGCFNLEVYKCNALLSGRFPLLSFMLSRGWSCLLDGKYLGLCESLFDASSVGDLGKDDWKGSLGEQRDFSVEHRAKDFLGEQRARGLVEEEEMEPCFCEDEGWKRFADVKVSKCFDELEEEMGLGEDLKGRGPASLWDCGKGLVLTATPVACMTLMCCWPSSSEVLGLWKNSAAD